MSMQAVALADSHVARVCAYARMRDEWNRLLIRKMKTSSRRQLIVLLALIQALHAIPADAFPPYKTTDADTADPYNLELRLGLLQATRGARETEYASPLLRANFGLPNKLELVSEFEYLPEEGEFGEGRASFIQSTISNESQMQ